jgi:hypothetical protein
LTRLFPDKLTGDTVKMRSDLVGFFGPMQDVEEIAENTQKRNARLLLIITSLVLLVVCIWVAQAIFGTETKGTPELKRSEIGGDTKAFTALAELKYGEASLKEEVTIHLQPLLLSKAENTAIIAAVAKRLPSAILGENRSIASVNSNLKLLRVDEKTGADVSWSSSNEAVISDEGVVNMIEAGAGTDVALNAHIRLGEESQNVVIAVSTGSPLSEYDWAGDLDASLTNVVRGVESSVGESSPVLPSKTGSGVKIKWSMPDEAKGHLPEILVLLGIGFAVFRMRYRSIEKLTSKMRGSMARDFPDFIGKLTLLLGAGMVLTAAIEKIVADYLSRNRAVRKREFYEQLVRMTERMAAGNVSLVREFSDIAVRSELRELMRFATVLSDNIDKGSLLIEKLNMEGETLWNDRKKLAQQEGAIAETKLTFPMCLQLLVVILITIMPAFLEM